MPPSTRMQRNRQRAAERAILGKIEENSAVIRSPIQDNMKGKPSLQREKVQSNVFDPTDGFDGLNPDHMRSLIDDLETEIKRRIDLVNEEREKAINFLKQEGRVMMFRFSADAKKMTVGQFFESYGIDLKTINFDAEDIDLQMEGGGKCAKHSQTDTPFHSNSRYHTPARLPNFSRKTMTPASTLRTVKKGERIYSKNGSPINEVDVGFMKATMGKKRSSKEKDESFEMNLDLHMGDGNYMQLCPENVQKLDENMKSIALKQLQVLKQNLAAIENCFDKK